MTAIQGEGLEKRWLPLPFILYGLNFLPWPFIICGDMGTRKKKKEKESKGDFATAISIGRWRWKHLKKMKSKKMREREEAYKGTDTDKWKNTLYKGFSQWCKQKINITLDRGGFSNMLPQTKPGMSFSPRNLAPRNFSKREKEAQIERPSSCSALCYLKWGAGERAEGLQLNLPGFASLLCTLMAVTLSKLLNPFQSHFLYL